MTGNATKSTQISASIAGIRRLPIGRQLGLVSGFVACILLAIYLVHWVSVDGTAVPAEQTASQVNGENKSETVSVTNNNRVWEAGQLVFGGMLAVLLLFGVLRPVMRDLASMPGTAGTGMHALEVRHPNNPSTSHGEAAGKFAQTQEYETFLNTVRDMAKDDPKRVAQLLKRWLNDIPSK
jgi:hypothetical protein